MVNQCLALLENARNLRKDPRIVEYHKLHKRDNTLSSYKVALKNILIYATKNKYITEDQSIYINRALSFYQSIKVLNASLEPGFDNLLVNSLESLIDFVDSTGIKEQDIIEKKLIVRERIGQIKEGEYFWNQHLKHGDLLIVELKTKKFSINEELEEVITSYINRLVPRGK